MLISEIAVSERPRERMVKELDECKKQGIRTIK